MPNKFRRLKFVLFVAFVLFVSNVFGIDDGNFGKITGEVNLFLKQEKIAAKLKYD
jgi:hypothetical protein